MNETRSNDQWLADLVQPGPMQEAALEDLRAHLTRLLPYAIDRWLPGDHPAFAGFLEEVVQDTLLRVLDRLHTFEGRAQFTTWVYKIAVRIALSELRRARWKDYSLDELVESAEASAASSSLLLDNSPGPEDAAEKKDLMRRVMLIVQQELTPRQRQALLAIAVHGISMETLAQKMGTNRNALYKLLHDARLGVKRRLEAEGLSSADVLAVFSKV